MYENSRIFLNSHFINILLIVYFLLEGSFEHHGLAPGGVVALLFGIALLGFLAGFVLYAYKYPQSRAGIWMIEVRLINDLVYSTMICK